MPEFPPSSPQFELRRSQSAMVDLPEPKYMSVAHFCATYGAAISEVEIVSINGGQFVDLDSSQAKLLILRAKFSKRPPGF
jgi:hypothetical protein